MMVRYLKWLSLILVALPLQACDKKSGSGKPAAAPRSGQSAAKKAAPGSDDKGSDEEGSKDEELVPPPDQGGYAPVD